MQSNSQRFHITITDTHPIPLATKTLYAPSWITAQRRASRYLDDYTIINIMEVL